MNLHRLRQLFLILVWMCVSCTSSEQRVDDLTVAVENQTNEIVQRQEPEHEIFVCMDTNCAIGIFTDTITQNEAKILLQQIYGTDNVSFDDNRIEWRSSAGIGNLQFNNEQIIIDASFTLREKQLGLSDLIKQIGEPSLVYIVRAFSENYPCAGSAVLYPPHNIEVILYQENASIGILPNQFIQRLTFAYENLVPTDTWVVEWQGFLDYCDLVTNPTTTP